MSDERKPIAIWTREEAALWHQAPRIVQDAWDAYAQTSADKYNASDASLDRDTNVLHQWTPPLSFSRWRDGRG